MPKGEDRSAAKEPPHDEKDRTHIQAEAQSDTEPFVEKTAPLPELHEASEDLKTRIAEAKRRNAMPIDSALGNPNWEGNAADGHLDVPEEEDDR